MDAQEENKAAVIGTLKVSPPHSDTAATAAPLQPFHKSPQELFMSSVGRLLIFHASTGTAHVHAAAHFSLPLPALLWFHLTFPKIRSRFDSGGAA